MIKRLKVGQMEANCYVVWGDPKEALIIDPGEDADYIIQTILSEELTPQALIATHGHIDHILAALELELAFNIPFYINEADEFLVKKMRESAKHFLEVDPGPPPIITSIDRLPNEDFSLEIIQTPGHTPGSICLYNQYTKSLFSGDIIFAGGEVGRTDRAYSNKNDFNKSIEKIMKLPKDTVVYPGHGESFLLSHFSQK